MNPFIRVILIAFICFGAVFAQNVADVSRLQLQVKLDGFYDSVNTVSHSPDGKFIVTGGNDGVVIVWNLSSGKEVRRFLGHTGSVLTVAFSPDGYTVASGSSDSTIRLWDISSGASSVLVGHSSGVNSVVFSPDGLTVASGSSDSTARLWRLSSKIEIMRFVGHTEAITSVAFNPDGRSIATASFDKTVLLWNISTGRSFFRLYGDDLVEAVSFSRDGRILAIGTLVGGTVLYDLITKKQTVLVSILISSVDFAYDNLTVATAARDGTIRVWNIYTGQEIMKLESDNSTNYYSFTDVSFNPTKSLSLVGTTTDGEIIIWDLSSRKINRVLMGHTGFVRSVVFSPNSNFLVTLGSKGIVQIWDTNNGKEFRRLNAPDSTYCMDLSTDGEIIATCGYDKKIHLWNVTTGKETGVLSGHSESVYSVSFSHDGQFLVSGSDDKTARVWDVTTRQLKLSFNHRNPVTSVKFSRDGKSIFTTDSEGSIFLWNVNAQKITREFEGHKKIVYAVVVSPDGNSIASASEDSTIRLWDIATGKELKRFSGHTKGVFDIAFSPNEKTLASAGFDTTNRLWDIPTGQEIGQLKGNLGSSYSVAFSSDGTRIAVGSNDTARIYSTPDFAPIFATRASTVTTPTTPSKIPMPTAVPVGATFNQDLKPTTPHQSISASLKGCIRINAANPETVTCRITFALQSGETPVQVVSIRAIDTASRVITPYQFAFLIPNAIPSKSATLTTSPLTLEFYMTVPKEITRIPVLDVKVGNSSLWEYTPRFQAVPIS